MPHKLLRMHRTEVRRSLGQRPVMIAIAGDSAAGKTTLTRGLVNALGPERMTAALHIHGYAPGEESRVLEKAIWASLSQDADLPERLGTLDDDGRRSEPLAITQLLLLYHLLEAAS